MPDDFSTAWLPRQQILDVLNFYYPECIDHVHGGYVLQFDEGDADGYSQMQSCVRVIRTISSWSSTVSPWIARARYSPATPVR